MELTTIALVNIMYTFPEKIDIILKTKFCVVDQDSVMVGENSIFSRPLSRLLWYYHANKCRYTSHAQCGLFNMTKNAAYKRIEKAFGVGTLSSLKKHKPGFISRMVENPRVLELTDVVHVLHAEYMLQEREKLRDFVVIEGDR